jgi:hypothetical protein
MQLRRPDVHECYCRASTQHLMRVKLSPSQWAALQCYVVIRAMNHSCSGTCAACDRAAMIPIEMGAVDSGTAHCSPVRILWGDYATCVAKSEPFGDSNTVAEPSRCRGMVLQRCPVTAALLHASPATLASIPTSRPSQNKPSGMLSQRFAHLAGRSISQFQAPSQEASLIMSCSHI